MKLQTGRRGAGGGTLRRDPAARGTAILIINILLAHGFNTSLFNDIPIYPRIANSSRTVSTRTLRQVRSEPREEPLGWTTSAPTELITYKILPRT